MSDFLDRFRQISEYDYNLRNNQKQTTSLTSDQFKYRFRQISNDIWKQKCLEEK